MKTGPHGKEELMAIYEGKKLRMLIVLTFLKACNGRQSYCSLRQYATSLRWDRHYKLVDGGMVAFITRL